jgi:hypothetical protein
VVLSVLALPLEVFNLLTSGVSHRVPGQMLFARFHEFLAPGIEDARLDHLSSAEVTNRHFPAEPFQDDAALVFRGILPTGRGSELPDESSGLLRRGLCGLALINVVLRHFWLLSRCG